MSYSTPKTWAHGDTVSAANMQKYSDGLDAIKPLFPTQKINWAQPQSLMDDAQENWIVHKARWLIYKSTGEVTHPTDPTTYPNVSLSDTGGVCAFDLDAGVDWLVVGQLYRVIGCSIAYEDEQGVIV
jgi:hypothetical protein